MGGGAAMSSPDGRGHAPSDKKDKEVLGFAPSDRKEKEVLATRNTLGVGKYRTDPFPFAPSCSSMSSGCTGAGAAGELRGEVLVSTVRGEWAGRDPESD